MSVLLALTTAVILIVWGMIRSRKPKEVHSPVLVQRYVHAGHSWMRVAEDGDVLIGIDDFAQSLIGSVEEVRLPGLLRRVKQGQVAFHVRHGNRVVPIVSPVTGRVVQKNEAAMQDPGLVNRSPYGEGWLLRIHPRRVAVQLPNLLTGRAAMQWQDLARVQLARLFSGTPALMYQDGGVMLENLSDRCSDEEWRAIQREIFLTGEAQ